MEDLTRLFSIDRVIKGAASFDAKKLFAFQEMHMQKKTVEEKYELCLPFLQKVGSGEWGVGIDSFTKKLIAAAGERIRVAGDILDFTDFFLPDDAFPYDEAALEKRITSDPMAKELLTAFREKLAQLDAAQFDAGTLEKVMGDFLEEKQIKIGQIIHALRVAVTGKAVGLGLFETLEILGKDRVLARIGRTLTH